MQKCDSKKYERAEMSLELVSGFEPLDNVLVSIQQVSMLA